MVDGFQFDHGMDGSMFVTPREQGIIWSCWDHHGEVLESIEWAETFLRDKENGLNFPGFGCLGRWEVETGIRFTILVEAKMCIPASEVLCFAKGASGGDRDFSKMHHAPEGAQSHSPNTGVEQFINIERGL